MGNREALLRERVVSAAGDLFYAEGITATGVDRVAEVAGVSKRTLYKYFGSKDALVAACLQARDAPTRAQFTAGAEAITDDPRAQLDELFRTLTGWLSAPQFRGCPFINASAELPDPALPARQAARDHKQRLRHWIRDRAQAAGIADPESMSWQLMALFDGALAQRLVLGADAPTAAITSAATTLLDGATRAARSPAEMRKR